MSGAIKAVMLDALGTVIDLEPSFAGAFAQVCQDFGYQVSEDAVAQVLPIIEQIEQQRLSNEENLRVTNEFLMSRWIKMNKFIFKMVGIDGDAVKLAVEMERRFQDGSYTRLFPDTIPVLSRLREQGVRLGIVSNGTASVLNCLRYHQLDSYVDFILISGIVGWEKPARQIFELALNKAGVKAQNAVFVGDHYLADIEGARRVGIRPILINRNRRPHTFACEEIETLFSLLEILKIK
ncbi:HAD family hydrolase [Candidatus Sumerlaeota bacterium]|nr:HAD family hydrolase [Candidatus Sumerlaeota bacterium]